VTTGEQSVSRADALVAMADYTADTFAGLIGQVFRFEPADATVAGSPALLVLIDITRRAASTTGTRDSFLLLFQLRSDTPLGPGLHRIVREGFEPCEWFLNRVVVPGRAPGAYYQAVFG
jgi:hypothetical protein